MLNFGKFNPATVAVFSVFDQLKWCLTKERKVCRYSFILRQFLTQLFKCGLLCKRKKQWD